MDRIPSQPALCPYLPLLAPSAEEPSHTCGFGTQPNMENVEETDSLLTRGQFREYLVETLPKSGKKDSPDRSSNVGFSHEGMRETLKEPSAYRIPMECGHPAGHQSVSSKLTTMGQDQGPRTTYTTLHRCAFCPKEFKTVFLLRRHERVHTGQRPFKCDVCEKSFRRKYNLSNHKHTHTG